MKIKRPAMAGTMESSDVQVLVRPTGNDANEIIIDSPVKVQFGDAIENVVKKVLESFGVQGVQITLNDRGALDATIAARVQAALCRGAEELELDWEVVGKWNG